MSVLVCRVLIANSSKSHCCCSSLLLYLGTLVRSVIMDTLLDKTGLPALSCLLTLSLSLSDHFFHSTSSTLSLLLSSCRFSPIVYSIAFSTPFHHLLFSRDYTRSTESHTVSTLTETSTRRSHDGSPNGGSTSNSFSFLESTLPIEETSRQSTGKRERSQSSTTVARLGLVGLVG
jgi:hypothetical protein